ncbi:hypothetical protein ACFVT5_37955 [Streptomyces sp. NPDC058001]|uniref:hypothetical protein n=1 Tax=Streptomyces sp. NPDC058001 TaxID=3346300 RepID=UPI0036E7EADF
MRTRIAPFTMTAVLLAGGTAAATTGSASATEPKTNAAIQAACLDTARGYTSAAGSGSRNAFWPEVTGTWAYTTSSCLDINVKPNDTGRIKACFKATNRCNGWTQAYKGQWALAATDVYNSTAFYIQFEGTARSTGLIAY